MQKFNKISIVTVLTIVFAFAGPVVALAATTPSLGAADTFGILGGTYTNTSVTTVTGDVGYTTGPATAPTMLGGTIYGAGDPTPTAKTDAAAALTALSVGDNAACTETLGVIVNLSTVGTHSTGVYTPGVYCSTGAMSIGTAGITLNGAGTYIFRAVGALTSVADSVVTLADGASSCDVFWTPTAATTLGANTTFVGTIIDNAHAITVGGGTIWKGRALSLGAGTVTTNTDTITATCAVAATADEAATVATASSGGGSLHVPIIDIVKVPSPLALPNGPGPVTYTYTVRNIGVVPMNNVTVVDDTCSPMIFVSGDTNHDSNLDVNETWTYDCFKTLSATQTNTVVATGWNNGFSATDIAIATVVVGAPIVPPLIHITKIPSPLALPAGGGMVTYTKTVTNPGTVALSNIQLADDKCSPVAYVSGDTNGDLKLDPTETWIYTCQMNLTATTTNTVTVSGQANGLTARDFAIVTVGVAAPAPAFTPTLPNTGFPPEQKSSLWNIIMLAGIAMLALASLVLVIKKRTA